MIVAHNLYAMNAQRQLNINGLKQKKSTEKLSSGYRINRAGDDAAGLAISEKMRGQIRGLNRASENVQDGISFVQTADGALEQVVDCLHRINELSIQAANGTNSESDRRAINQEVQELKTEISRIFITTKFNETFIWDRADGVDVAQYGLECVGQVQAAAFDPISGIDPVSGSSKTDITAANCGVMPYGEYTVSATEQDGVKVSWTGYNGNSYSTDWISWDTVESGVDGKPWSFHIGDHYNAADTELFDAGTGEPLIDRLFALEVEEDATFGDVAAAINGTYMPVRTSCSVVGQFNTPGAPSGMSAVVSLNDDAAFAAMQNSGASFDRYISPADAGGNKVAVRNLVSFPTASTVADAKTNNDVWKFSFYMEGIGRVTATSTAVSYRYSDNSVSGTLSPGTLGMAMTALTDGRDASTPGLLSSGSGGKLAIYFAMEADSGFPVGNTTHNNKIGAFSLWMDVGAGETAASMLDRINNTLNSNTTLEIMSQPGTADQFQTYRIHEKPYKIDKYESVFQGMVTMYSPGNIGIHAGADADGTNKLHLRYETLSLGKLGMQFTHTTTEKASLAAIDEVSKALQIVTAQRSLFGAYQNRLEHTMMNVDNVAENTQAAESRIRDTDMAEEMVSFSKENILAQAGQAMLVQANQIQQHVLNLLQ